MGFRKKTRSDPGTVSMSEQLMRFCKLFQIQLVTCPRRDHCGNGKIENFIRTLKERLRTNKSIKMKMVVRKLIGLKIQQENRRKINF